MRPAVKFDVKKEDKWNKSDPKRPEITAFLTVIETLLAASGVDTDAGKLLLPGLFLTGSSLAEYTVKEKALPFKTWNDFKEWLIIHATSDAYYDDLRHQLEKLKMSSSMTFVDYITKFKVLRIAYGMTKVDDARCLQLVLENSDAFYQTQFKLADAKRKIKSKPLHTFDEICRLGEMMDSIPREKKSVKFDLAEVNAKITAAVAAAVGNASDILPPKKFPTKPRTGLTAKNPAKNPTKNTAKSSTDNYRDTKGDGKMSNDAA